MRRTKQAVGSIQLQDRDLAILRGLFESRIMTRTHIAALYFDGHAEAGKKRVQKLTNVGLIGERKRGVNEASILFISKRGLLHLRERGILSEYPPFSIPALVKRAQVSELTIRHELEVMDVKAAFYSALRGNPRLLITEFNTWPRHNEFIATHPRKGPTLIKPDGFISVQKQESADHVTEQMFFLEVDRSTEVLDTLVFRAACYLNYYRSGDFAVRHRASQFDFKKYPFRVLMVFKTVDRRNHMAQQLLQNNPPILTLVYLTTIKEATTYPVSAIWIRPLDYRISMSGMGSDWQRQADHGNRRRQLARDPVTEEFLMKQHLWTV